MSDFRRLNSTTSSSSSAPSHNSVFFNEISDIMHGYGDCESPLRDSIVLVEKIMHQQLNGILAEAIQYASTQRKRRDNGLTQADFEHLMRKRPEKIFRLQKHLKDLGLRKKIHDMLAGRPVGLAEEPENPDRASEGCLREVAEKYDEEKTRRLFRADRISQLLTGTQYQQYNVAKRTSFYCRNATVLAQRFRTWLTIPSDVYISNHILAILSYLAHETIATIVDLAILVRLNSANRAVDPYQRYSHAGITHQMLHLCPDVTQGRGGDGIRPITVQEINEAMRRFTFMSNNQLVGRFRNTKPEGLYLAL